MGSFSKLLPYTCYELGHCWHHSCSFTSFEICIIAFIESCKIYGVVYLLTGLINARKISIEYGRKILKDYLTSVCFLTVNAFGYIGSFCVLRSILRHVNFLTASFLPGFIASFMAIFVERQERRSLLAIYVTNVASECLWNSAVGRGYVKPIPHGEILIFAGAMAVLGYSFRSSSPPSRLVNSILQLFLGRGESGVMIASRQVTHPILSEQLDPKPQPWPMKLLSVFTFHHPLCPHRGGCLPHFFRMGLQGFSQGFLLQLAVKLLSSASRIVKSPWKVINLLLNGNNISAGIFLAWFISVFKGTCCAGRWWHGKDDPSHGAVAGVLSALSMYFYSAPSLALYMMWKVLESLYEKGCDDGYLPRIPKSVEILYSLSTGYLFHTAVMEKQYMKPSYWRFLKSLTWNRLSMYNRHLLDCYGLNSSQDFHNYWPDYDLDQIGDAVKQMLPQHIAETSL
ncbi:transmembrane protein 135-like [Panulirus ornatus]|uniref:transmembrane protein 135-like n=1 Tax=Panulirus ornatus TaxID=150431 RepID=UPI003A87AAEA